MNRKYFNVVKGIGMLSVIIGHTVWFLKGYMYVYHLPLFFFLAGYFYSEQKYGEDPFSLVKRKLETNWIAYVIVMWVAVFLHNFFYDHRMLRTTELRYSKPEIAEKLCQAIFGVGDELFAGPMWFVPVLVLAVLALGFIVSISKCLEGITKSKIVKYGFQAVVIGILVAVFYPLVQQGYHFTANIQFSMMVLPYLWVAYLLRKKELIMDKYLNPVVAVLCALVVYYIGNHYFIDMTLQLIYPIMYPAALCGIYVCLTVAKYLKKVRLLEDAFAYMGEHSLFYLCAHYIILRLTDVFLCRMAGDVDGSMYDVLPVSFEEKWWLYLIIVLPASTLLCMGYNVLKAKWNFAFRNALK